MHTCSPSLRWLPAAIILSSALAFAGCKRQEPKPVPGPEAAATAEPVSADAKTAAQQIAPVYLRDQITKLSSDEFEGRGPATPGAARTETPAGSFAFVPVSVAFVGVIGLVMGMLGSSLGILATLGLYVLLGFGYGTACWLAARSGYLPFPTE